MFDQYNCTTPRYADYTMRGYRSKMKTENNLVPSVGIEPTSTA